MANTYAVFKAIGGVTDTAGAPNITGAIGGLITVLDFCLVTTAGWTKEFSGTNTACYRAPGGNRIYVSIDDTTTINARVRCFESASAVLAGVGQFPTELQVPGGLYIMKSTTGDATTRAYWCMANDRACHLMIYQSALNFNYFFGDIVSLKTGGESVSNMFLMANNSSAPTNTTGQAGMWVTTAWSVHIGHYMARPVTGIGGSTQVSKTHDISRAKSPTYEHGGSGPPYPSVVTGGLQLGKVYVADPTHGPRGYLPGLIVPCHAKPIPQGVTFTPPAGGLYAGRTYFCSYGANDGCGFYETSNGWDA